MDTNINQSEKFRLYMFIALCVAILGLSLWFYNSDDNEAEGDTVVTGDESQQNDVLMSIIKPSFDVVRISRGGTGVIAGRATPGAIVEIRMGEEILATITADNSGEWVAIIEKPLAPGSAELVLVAINPGQAGVTESSSVVVVSVPERDENRFVEREENGVVAVLTPRDGKGPSRILQRPGGGFRDVGESLSVDLIDYGVGDQAIISGLALPRVDVLVYLDNAYVGKVRASDEGTWQLSLSSDKLGNGAHIIRLDQTVGEGDVQLRIEQPFQMGEVIDTSLAEGGVIVKPGNTLWHLARRLYGSGVRYTMIFKENSDAIRDPDLIYPGQMFKLPSTDQN